MPLIRRTTFGAGVALLARMAALQGLQIICIDEHADTLEILRVILEMHGARAYTAATAGHGLWLLSRIGARVLIIDLALPDIDGITLMSNLRTMPAFKSGDLQVIVLSAHCTERDRRAALMAGVSRFLSKPFDEKQLVACIQSLVGAKVA
jgi:DNA-binding response OmpR family regulator